VVTENSRSTVIAIISVFVLFVLFGLGLVISLRLPGRDSVLPVAVRLAAAPLPGAITSEGEFLRILGVYEHDGRSVGS